MSFASNGPRVLRVGAAAAALLCFSCGAAPRFKDQPIVWRVDDQKDIDEPEELLFDRFTLGFDWFVGRRLSRTLELPDKEHAHNTNALDDVPDSSWFTNRIGVREVSPEEAARAVSAAGPPNLPLTIVSGKSGGANPGFFAKDSTGRRFVIKFDTLENPEMQTGTGVIVNRIFWTLGYFVANDSVFEFSRDQLKIAPGATLKDAMMRKHPMTTADVEAVLATAPRMSNGRYRASSSEFIEGIPKGGFAAEGTRPDDPNDVIEHQHRREVRALRVFAAWVNHTDMKEDNSLDAYVTENGRRFIRHYLIDFGEALGAHAAEKGRYEDGYEHYWDWEKQSKAFASLGLWKRPWEDEKETPWASIGAFSADNFDPEEWREAYPFWPFFEMDASDAYWGAKLVLRFDRPMLRAIVATGRFSSPEASEYLVNTLLARREIIGRSYLEAVTPLDYFEINPTRLCATDLGVRYGLAAGGLVQALDENDEVAYSILVNDQGRVCLPIHAEAGYRIYRLRVARGHDFKPLMQVHFKSGQHPRILGVVRKEQ